MNLFNFIQLFLEQAVDSIKKISADLPSHEIEQYLVSVADQLSAGITDLHIWLHVFSVCLCLTRISKSA